MALSRKELDELIRLVRLTKDEEIDCEQCLALVAELVEQAQAGKPIPDELEAVVHHLRVCTECEEEYEALERMLNAIADRAD